MESKCEDSEPSLNSLSKMKYLLDPIGAYHMNRQTEVNTKQKLVGQTATPGLSATLISVSRLEPSGSRGSIVNLEQLMKHCPTNWEQTCTNTSYIYIIIYA